MNDISMLHNTSLLVRFLKAWFFPIVVATLMIGALATIWIPRYFPSEDGPLHLQTAVALRYYNHSDFPIYKHYYTLTKDPEPNILGHLLLRVILELMPPREAEKAFLTFYTVLFLFSFALCIRALWPGRMHSILFAFPFIFAYPTMLGFYNYILSFALSFFVIGSWSTYLQFRKAKYLLSTVFLTTLTYFAHPVAVIIICLYMLISVFCSGAIDIRKGHASDALARAGACIVSLLPSLLLLTFFMDRQGGFLSLDLNFRSKALHFLSLSSLFSFDFRELGLSSLLSLFTAVILISAVLERLTRRTGFRHDDAILVTAIACCIVYFVAPDNLAGGGFLLCRLIPYPFLLVLLWSAGQPVPPIVRRTVYGLFGSVSIAFFVIYILFGIRISNYLTELESCKKYIESNRTVVLIPFNLRGCNQDGRLLSDRVAPFMNAGGYLAVKPGVVDLSNLIGWTGYAILDFRPELNPGRFLHKDATYYIADKALLDYSRATPGEVDYVILWQKERSICRSSFRDMRSLPSVSEETSNSLSQQLREAYSLIYTSEPGNVSLYRLNTLP